MKRRMVWFAVVLALLLLMVPGAAYAADTALVVKVPETLPKAGDVFTVSVDIEGNPGFAAAGFTLTFNADDMECLRIRTGELLSGRMCVVNPRASSGAIFGMASVDDVQGDGELGAFTFRALKDLSAYDFGLKKISFTDAATNALTPTIRMEVQKSTVAPDDSQTAQSGGVFVAGETEPDGTPGEQAEGGQDSATKAEAPSFTDVGSHWGKPWIERAVELKLFSGYPDGTFRPNDSVTRADLVTVLWRSENSPEPASLSAFEDVDAGRYYAKAVAWASENGYVSGRSETLFDPESALTRQEAMKILFAYSGGVSGMEVLLGTTYDDVFTDSGDISGWAKPAMYWAYYHEIISGSGDHTLNPRGVTTRAELAKILVNYLDK